MSGAPALIKVLKNGQPVANRMITASFTLGIMNGSGAATTGADGIAHIVPNFNVLEEFISAPAGFSGGFEATDNNGLNFGKVSGNYDLFTGGSATINETISLTAGLSQTISNAFGSVTSSIKWLVIIALIIVVFYVIARSLPILKPITRYFESAIKKAKSVFSKINTGIHSQFDY